MGRKSKSGGVEAKGDRIQYTFSYLGKRVRPTENLRPTKAALEAARRRLKDILRAIEDGTFNFAEEFPGYQNLSKLSVPAVKVRTVSEVCKDYIASLQARRELAFSTVTTYRRILAHVIEGQLGEKAFSAVTFDELEKIVNAQAGAKKTYNNKISAIKGAWEYGYKNLPNRANPAAGLDGVRITKKEKPKPDPFHVHEALEIIRQVGADWGEHQANYDEGRFFTGLRPSEQIPLEWTDVDFAAGGFLVCKARVMGRPKDETKTYEDRFVQFNPRSRAVFERQRALYAEYKLKGWLALEENGQPHNRVFFHENGIAYNNLQIPWKRWDYSIAKLRMRARPPYCARHSSISWNLMMGRNILWVATQHGHSVEVMLASYAKWLERAGDADVQEITRAFGFATDLPPRAVASMPSAMIPQEMMWRSGRDSNPSSTASVPDAHSAVAPKAVPSSPPQSPDLPPDLPPARPWGKRGPA